MVEPFKKISLNVILLVTLAINCKISKLSAPFSSQLILTIKTSGLEIKLALLLDLLIIQFSFSHSSTRLSSHCDLNNSASLPFNFKVFEASDKLSSLIVGIPYKL